MNDSMCPVCGRPNPNTMDICQYCGSALKKSATVPLEPLHPGDIPIKRKTSDLEGTLPGWLRDARKANTGETPADQNRPVEPPPAAPVPPAPTEQPVAKPVKAQPKPVSPLDFLAGLGQAGEEDEEETPDWLQSLKESMPAPVEPPPPAPTPAAAPTNETPASWLAGLEEPTAHSNEPAPENNLDWGFGNQPAAFSFDDSPENAAPDQDETPDWLTALKAQDESAASAPVQAAPAAPAQNFDENLPDWLSTLSADGGLQAETLPATPIPPAAAGETPDWLSALGAESGLPVETAPTASGETPDWLSSLGTESGLPATTPPVASGETPDWLSSLEAGSGLPVESAPAASGETPDWLSSLGTESGLPATTPPVASGETPDWLSSLGEESDLPAQVASAPAGETPDWLASLGTESSLPAETTPAAAAENSDWLASFGAESSLPAETPSATTGETPDWLSSLGAESGLPSETVPAPSAENSDWLASFGAESSLPAETQSATTGETPDWLSSLGTESSLPAETTPTAEAETSDWLASFGAESSLPAETPSATTGETPDWLSNLGAESGLPAETAPAAAAETSDWLANFGTESSLPAEAAPADLPDWMSGLQEQAAAPAEPLATPAVELPTEAAPLETPDWMSSLGEAQPISAEPQPATGAGELPDWLSEAMGETPVEKPVEPLAQPRKAFETGSLGDLGPFGQETALPDWMQGLGTPSENEKPAESPVEMAPEAAAVENSLFESLPAASVESPSQTPPVEPAPQPVVQDQNLDEILALDLPDWLSGFTPTKSELETESPEQAGDANLQPADLPSWVQAMRPVESVMAGAGAEGEEDQDLVNTGPLAGLRSVLPSQGGTAGTHKPKSYSIKLQVTETQQSQAALLEYLLNSEKTPQVAPRQKETLILRPLRWVIAGVLFLVVLISALFSTLTGTVLFPPPNPATAANEIVAFNQTVEALPAGATVLVVVDYQPGFAGEMEPASGAVLRRLMEKDARLAFISTTPMGVLLGERLINQADQARTGAAPYALKEQYVNLGYLPGGAGSIKVFTEQPQQTIGQDWDVGNLWETQALAGAKRDGRAALANFSAILVLTDNPDTGRLWIEQTNEALGEIPVPRLLVVSAQAEPLMLPYYVSNQVQGLLAGLEGGANYEALLSNPGPAHTQWNAFGTALLTTILLMLGGGAWSLITDRQAKRPRPEQDEA